MRKENSIQLRPTYWATVSGGKDSLYMLKYILSNLDRYPLDGVVHYELDIDFPFIKNVIDYMEAECQKYGIRFFRIKPRKTWDELYEHILPTGNKMGFPTRTARWCNSKYKLDAKKQLDNFLKQQGAYAILYIGYCANETKRFANRKEKDVTEVYPLVQAGVFEQTILAWARNVPIFNNYYKSNTRCGCMYCPCASLISYAYLLKYYPDKFDYMIAKMRETEEIRSQELGRPFSVTSDNPKYNADYVDMIVREKWIKILEDLENCPEQLEFDFERT